MHVYEACLWEPVKQQNKDVCVELDIHAEVSNIAIMADASGAPVFCCRRKCTTVLQLLAARHCMQESKPAQCGQHASTHWMPRDRVKSASFFSV